VERDLHTAARAVGRRRRRYVFHGVAVALRPTTPRVRPGTPRAPLSWVGLAGFPVVEKSTCQRFGLPAWPVTW